jgi:hypothetical protein
MEASMSTGTVVPVCRTTAYHLILTTVRPLDLTNVACPVLVVKAWLHSVLTSARAGAEWSTSRPGRFTSGKEPRHPSKRRLGGPQSRSRRFCVWVNLLRSGFQIQSSTYVISSISIPRRFDGGICISVLFIYLFFIFYACTRQCGMLINVS